MLSSAPFLLLQVHERRVGPQTVRLAQLVGHAGEVGGGGEHEPPTRGVRDERQVGQGRPKRQWQHVSEAREEGRVRCQEGGWPSSALCPPPLASPQYVGPAQGRSTIRWAQLSGALDPDHVKDVR